MSLIKKSYRKVPNGPTAYFDVDDTLVMWEVPEDVVTTDLVVVKCRGHREICLPNKYNIELLEKMARRGHSIIVWSAGGSDWAEAVVIALGLEKYVDVVVKKPTYYIDDIADPSKIIGKHGYFTIDGKRSGADDHLKHRQDFEDEYEELRK